MNTLKRNDISRLALSVLLLVCSIVWFAGACAWYVHSDSKDGWSETPLLAMSILIGTPILCVITGAALVYARVRLGGRLTWVEWCALLAGFIAVVSSGWLVFMVFDSMGGMHMFFL